MEKPEQGTAPSDLAIMGRYILTPEIFTFLDKQEEGAGGEVQLTDAIQKLSEMQQVFAYNFEGKRYDVGEKLGFVKTTLELALERPELQEEVLDYMKVLLEKSYAPES